MARTTKLRKVKAEGPDQLASLLIGLQPAFQHARTGEAHLPLRASGELSSDFDFSGLPDSWIIERDAGGQATVLHPDIKAGIWHHARFISLEQLDELQPDA